MATKQKTLKGLRNSDVKSPAPAPKSASPKPQLGGPTQTTDMGANTKKTGPRPDSERSPSTPKSHTTRPVRMYEDAPAMSVGANGPAIGAITDPTTNYASQVKKKYNKIMKRKKV